MIVEHAQVFVTPGREAEFEADFPRAYAVISRAGGFGWAELTRFVERPSVFLLLVRWDSLQDHLDFRASDLFRQWRAVIGPYFAEQPIVEHVTSVTAGIRPATD